MCAVGFHMVDRRPTVLRRVHQEVDNLVLFVGHLRAFPYPDLSIRPMPWRRIRQFGPQPSCRKDKLR